MSEIKLEQSIINLQNVLARLKEAIDADENNPLIIDATIQRFEFVIELYWKTLKRLLAQQGILTNTPKDTLQKAYTAKWIENETAWLEMLRDRNETSHIYNQNKAKEIYQHIKNNFPELQNTFNKLKNEINL